MSMRTKNAEQSSDDVTEPPAAETADLHTLSGKPRETDCRVVSIYTHNRSRVSPGTPATSTDGWKFPNTGKPVAYGKRQPCLPNKHVVRERQSEREQTLAMSPSLASLLRQTSFQQQVAPTLTSVLGGNEVAVTDPKSLHRFSTVLGPLDYRRKTNATITPRKEPSLGDDSTHAPYNPNFSM